MGLLCQNISSPSPQEKFTITLVKKVIEKDGYSSGIYTKLWNMAGIREHEVTWALQFV